MLKKSRNKIRESSLEKEKTENIKKLSQEEFEKKVLELSEKGLTSEKIGEELRQQGIHPKEYIKKISQILKEKNKYTNPDLKNLEEKLKKITVHSEKNKQDKRAMREKERIFAHIRKLKKYLNVPIR